MARIEMRLNGRKINSEAQLGRKLKRSMEKHVENSLKKATGPGVRIKKNRNGYSFEGAPEQIEQLKKGLR